MSDILPKKNTHTNRIAKSKATKDQAPPCCPLRISLEIAPRMGKSLKHMGLDRRMNFELID